MEYKVGTQIKWCGHIYIVSEAFYGCKGCYFWQGWYHGCLRYSNTLGWCGHNHRKDEKDIIFIKRNKYSILNETKNTNNY